MVQKWILPSAIALVGMPVAAAEPAHFEFRGITTAPLSQVEQRKTFRKCTTVSTGTLCEMPRGEVAGVPADPPEVVYNGDGSMAVLSVHVDYALGERLLAALVAKYGPPTEEKDVSVQRALGGPIPGKVVRWRFSDGSGVFRSPGTETGTAEFMFNSNAEYQPKAVVDF